MAECAKQNQNRVTGRMCDASETFLRGWRQRFSLSWNKSVRVIIPRPKRWGDLQLKKAYFIMYVKYIGMNVMFCPKKSQFRSSAIMLKFLGWSSEKLGRQESSLCSTIKRNLLLSAMFFYDTFSIVIKVILLRVYNQITF